MVVGYDVTVFGNDHTRSETGLNRLVLLVLTARLTLLRLLGLPEEKIEHSERVVTSLIAVDIARSRRKALDAHYGIHRFLSGNGEIGFKRCCGSSADKIVFRGEGGLWQCREQYGGQKNIFLHIKQLRFGF